MVLQPVQLNYILYMLYVRTFVYIPLSLRFFISISKDSFSISFHSHLSSLSFIKYIPRLSKLRAHLQMLVWKSFIRQSIRQRQKKYLKKRKERVEKYISLKEGGQILLLSSTQPLCLWRKNSHAVISSTLCIFYFFNNTWRK